MKDSTKKKIGRGVKKKWDDPAWRAEMVKKQRHFRNYPAKEN